MLSRMIQMDITSTITTIFRIGTHILILMVGALAFKFSWNIFAPIYLVDYIPTQFINIPYWHAVSFFVICTFLGEQIQKLTPKIITIEKES